MTLQPNELYDILEQRIQYAQEIHISTLKAQTMNYLKEQFLKTEDEKYKTLGIMLHNTRYISIKANLQHKPEYKFTGCECSPGAIKITYLH